MLDTVRDALNPVNAALQELQRAPLPPAIEPFVPPALPPIVPTPERLPAAPVDSDWAQGVSGQQSQPIDLEMAQISDAVYDPSQTQVGNWTRVSDADLAAAGIDPASFENADTGLRAGLYTDGNGHYTLAFAGSNDSTDWLVANPQQGLGFQNEQYDQAVALAQQVANSPFGNQDNLVITGHSLGGGLASISALVVGAPAVTFNASGVHDNTLRQFGLDPATAKTDAADGQIRRYNIEADPLTNAQQDTWGLRDAMPDALGHEIVLDTPPSKLERPDWDWRHPIESGKAEGQYQLDRLAEPHLSGTVIDAMQQQRPWES